MAFMTIKSLFALPPAAASGLSSGVINAWSESVWACEGENSQRPWERGRERHIMRDREREREAHQDDGRELRRQNCQDAYGGGPLLDGDDG